MVPPLRRYRELRGESADDVAARLGKSAAYVRMIEAGRNLKLPKTIDAIAAAYRLPSKVFRALRSGRIGAERARKSSLDRGAEHVANCCTGDAA